MAEKLNTAFKLKSASKWTIGLLAITLAGATITAPATSVVSLVAATALTGIEITLVSAVFFWGIALVLLILRDYKKVKFKGKLGDNEAELELETE